MKNKILGLMALSAVAVLTLTGCNQPENPEEKVGIANPASVYCEDQGGTLVLEENGGICTFADGTYCEEWAYFRDECQPGELIYNTVSEEESLITSELYPEEDLADGEVVIEDVVYEEEVDVE